METTSVIADIVQNPAMRSYLVNFPKGEFLCREGDESRDLYILLSGRLDLLKGERKVMEIVETGTPIGEISFFLRSKRTASVKAADDVQALCIPQDKLENVLQKFPALMWRISEVLASRLDERTQAWFALTEFCDSVPDAVAAADREGRLIAWNRSAEILFGRDWDQLHQGTLEGLFEEPEAYRQAVKAMSRSAEVRDEVFVVRHPRRGLRYIAVSLNFLNDGQGNVTGVIALSRDVTEVQKIKRSYRRIRLWMIPLLLTVALGLGAAFFAFPRLQKDPAVITDLKQQALRDMIANDYLLLQSLAADALAAGDLSGIDPAVGRFIELHRKSPAPYSGIVFLGEDKKVVAAYSTTEPKVRENLVGGSYEAIPFEEQQGAGHSVLTPYWSNARSGFGQKGIEIAFKLTAENRFVGWLIFQMDARRLAEQYGADEQTLKKFAF
jgi:PAS domain S-box-containing protein